MCSSLAIAVIVPLLGTELAAEEPWDYLASEELEENMDRQIVKLKARAAYPSLNKRFWV